MNKRNNFLRSYLTYMHNTQIERFDPKPLFDALAAKVRQCIDSLNLLSDPIITAQLMRYRAAVRYEKERNFTEAGKLYRQLHSENQCPVLSEIVLGKESLMYLNHAEDSAALQRMKLYTQNHPQGILMPELLALCIRILLEHNQTETARDYMVQYISAYASTPYAEPIAFHLAQTLRITEKDWKKAIEYYEFVFTHFPQSKYIEDALYWAGWCLVQEGLKKSENRFFNQYNKSYPDGNWQGVISGYPR
jgi:tetratricopeptide (TPR) repeat protein